MAKDQPILSLDGKQAFPYTSSMAGWPHGRGIYAAALAAFFEEVWRRTENKKIISAAIKKYWAEWRAKKQYEKEKAEWLAEIVKEYSNGTQATRA